MQQGGREVRGTNFRARKEVGGQCLSLYRAESPRDGAQVPPGER